MFEMSPFGSPDFRFCNPACFYDVGRWSIQWNRISLCQILRKRVWAIPQVSGASIQENRSNVTWMSCWTRRSRHHSPAVIRRRSGTKAIVDDLTLDCSPHEGGECSVDVNPTGIECEHEFLGERPSIASHGLTRLDGPDRDSIRVETPMARRRP